MQSDLETISRYGAQGEKVETLSSAIAMLTLAIREAAALEVDIGVSEAAESTGLTPAAIRAHIRSRSLPARRVGKRLYRIRLSDLRAWSEPRRVNHFIGESDD